MSEEKIYKFFEKRPDEWFRCKDVIEEAKNEGISSTTVYRVLRKMVDKNILEKDRMEWKKSSYRLNPQAIPIERRKISRLDYEIEICINKEARNWKTEKEFIQGFSSWIGALSLYVILKRARTEMPFDEIAKSYLGSARAIIKRYIIQHETPTVMTGKGKTEKEWWSELLKRSITGLDQYEEYKPALEKFDEILKQMFPDQIREFEKVFAKVMENEGKQK